MEPISVVTQAHVDLRITSGGTEFVCEKRFPKNITIQQFKEKLEMITGCSSQSCNLELYDTKDNLLGAMDNDGALLGSYQVDDGCRVHATDPNVKQGQYSGAADEFGIDDRVKLSEEDYDSRHDSVRAFKRRMKMGEYAERSEDEVRKEQEAAEMRRQKEADHAATLKVGSRCEVRLSGKPSRRGVVSYMGATDFKPGLWVGVQYDEPVGQNDGSVKGRRYFECPAGYGGFVKAMNVECGDFPEFGLDELDEL